MKGSTELGEKPIGQLLWKYSLPGVVAMLVGAVYNVLDRIFIGKFSGEAALAGLTVAFPLMMLTFAVANLVGVGGGALIAIRFGEKNLKGASHVFGNVITSTILVGLFVTVVGLANLSGWLRIFGADETTLPFAHDFMQIILLGTTFQFVSFTLSNTVRTEGFPRLAMTSQITSVLVNLVLALIFVAGLRWGVRGAAMSTVLGQLCGLGVVLPHYLRKKSILKPQRSDWRLDWKLMGKISGIGSSAFLGTLGVSVSMTFLTTSLIRHGGVPAITSLGAINSLYTLFILPFFGIQQGLQPIIGYNHGAGRSDRVRKALYLATGTAMGMATVVFLLLELFPSFFIALFIQKDSATMPIAIHGMRIFMAMLPVIGINLMGITYFQSTAKAGMAIFLGMARQFIFLIPLVLAFSALFGLTGTWLATPVSDALSILMTIVFLAIDFRKYPLPRTQVTSA
jgi:putative MATE family efflux protein